MIFNDPILQDFRKHTFLSMTDTMTQSGNQAIALMSLCSQTQTYNSIFYLDPDLF